ncbi:AAA ATPase-like domain-containing protein [Desulfonema limicola]|uniref:AAA ATPase-like domain-containing protein n=1 Tax=Desulfonema limicola TaxID=45656 RepID=A0A975B9L7_9BACT|nr:ATP-binding protein [Desulfonema limicola]QTA81529.1 AAA ATPase-like domain-containing protein [Desulfonema limicola]
MKKLQNLPIGDSSFESIRKRNDLYVDKTRHIFQLISEGRYYFLSRPRRFGKSLTISTLRCLFQGRKELFKGLWIDENSNWEWREYPVISVDFNEISHNTPENLTLGIERSLKNTGQFNNIQLKEPLLKEMFKELILSLHYKTDMPVVILIDEYDKPIIDHLGKGAKAMETAKANRDILKSFFGVIKGGEVSDVLRFVFITGVSKFSRVSIFSELNNLEDMTMLEPYADMLGYTQNELETYFKPCILDLSKKTGNTQEEILVKLAQYYNGYRFSKKNVRVYNPFSVMCALKHKTFDNYWFETGTPTFLVNLLKDTNFPVAKIENLELDKQIFSVYDLERLQPEALLFQTGYITIKDVYEDELYAFCYPNQEVKISFLKYLMFFHVPAHGHEQSLFIHLSRHLNQENLDAFFETISTIFASIPYTIESKRDEAYFHTAFFLIVSASGINARSEVLTCTGRIDMIMEFSDKLYIIEFKCSQSAQAGIKQILEKKYAEPYKKTGKKIILMGINFDTQKRNISEWKVEEI